MAFKPYCLMCQTWHTEEEGHVEQYRAHVDTWIDHWCYQLARRVRHYEAQAAKRNDDRWDRENGELNA